MKKLIFYVLISSFIFSFLSFYSFASIDNPKVVYNGRELKLPKDQPIIVDNGRTLLPLRFLLNNLDVSNEEIFWNSETKEVNFNTPEGNTIQITVGTNHAKVDDEDVILETRSHIYNDRVYLPARFVAEKLGKEVSWFSDFKYVLIADRSFLENNEYLLDQVRNTLNQNSIISYSNITLVNTIFESCISDPNWTMNLERYQDILNVIKLSDTNFGSYCYMFYTTTNSNGETVMRSDVLLDGLGISKRLTTMMGYESLMLSRRIGLSPTGCSFVYSRSFIIDNNTFQVKGINDSVIYVNKKFELLYEIRDIAAINY